MTGMSRITGRALTEREHIAQSIGDILSTPIGSRVMRRDYGSLLFELIDQPLHGPTLLRAYTAAVVAIARWEPRIELTEIQRQVDTDRPGLLVLELNGRLRDGGEQINLMIPMGGV